jgi:WD40 repeat protein
MNTTLKDMMASRADAAPEPHIDIEAVVRSGQRRVRRHRALGGVAAGAAVVVAAVVASALHLNSDEPRFAGSGGFEVREVTYAENSTIHYGEQAIDVPHEVRSFTQTEDGFVSVDADDTIYFTDGHDTEAIGHAGAYTLLRTDDSGSYVAWVEIDDGELPEVVVYDTSIGAEILRTSDGNGDGPGYLSDYDEPSIDAIDGDTVYVRNAEGVVAIDITSHESSVLIEPDDDALLGDVANGSVALSLSLSGGGITVSPAADGANIRFPKLDGGELSPDGTVLAAYAGDGRLRMVNVATKSDVTPELGDYERVSVVQWIDDSTLTAYATPGRDGPADLLRCSLSSGTCIVAVPSVPDLWGVGDFRIPAGGDPEGS